MAIIIKLQLGTDIRRVTVEKPLSYAQIVELAHSLFEGSLPKEFVFKYKDDEGDLITIVSDRETEEAFRFFKELNVVRFTIEPVQPKKDSNPFFNFNNNNNTNPEDIIAEIVVPLTGAFKELFQDFTSKCENAFNSRQRESIHWGVTCDGCNAYPIRGIRHKCAQCPDYDLCETCEKKGTHKEHTFQKIERPLNRRRGQCPFNADPSEILHPAVCDNCNGRIKGTRYKCQSCPDYDLCEKCMPLKVHTADHSFDAISHPFCARGGRRWARRHGCGNSNTSNPATNETNTTNVPATPLTTPKKDPAKQEPQVPVPESPKAEPAKQEPPKQESPKPESPKPASPSAPPMEAPIKEEQPISPIEEKLNHLKDMGFTDRNKNIALLTRHNGDLVRVVMSLLN